MNHVIQLNTRLTGIQVGRAFAALAVVIFHANNFILPEKIFDKVDAGSFFNLGYAGVDFFFVLSGFIILKFQANQAGKFAFAYSFILKRAMRIFPFFWIVLIVQISEKILFNQSEFFDAYTISDILFSFALLPLNEKFDIVRVSWTLKHEILFYLIFSVSLFRRKLGTALLLVWLSAILAKLIFQFSPSYPFNFLFDTYNLLFFLGMLASVSLSVFSKSGCNYSLVFGILLFFTPGLLKTTILSPCDESFSPIFYGFASMLIVIGLSGSNISWNDKLIRVGDASFSIYLCHMPIMLLICKLLSKTGFFFEIGPFWSLFVLTLASTIFGCIVYLYIEKPVTRYFSKLLLK
ncbi:acyltransferase family protein [Donghicola mangrovi]|uniref:Acyltransferase n=1 Tax=Donghicola mangrovi TaxID=2729614 RepID=A0A850QAP1_9RHOB|nr:acyltransferase [Donghicola mangrovi]NVO23001.1 acyltransferase [Donghicola mangrovi]